VTTLEELASFQGIELGLFADFVPQDFEDLMKECMLPVVTRVRLRRQFAVYSKEAH
jgi:hypothetical protein